MMADGLVSTLNASQSQNYGNKKDVGEMSLALTYPHFQALALPLHKDKQRRACPRQVIIYTHYGLTIPYNIRDKRVHLLLGVHLIYIIIGPKAAG